MPGDLDASRAKTMENAGYRHVMAKRCPDAARAWLVEGLPRWSEATPAWLTREWWDALPEALRGYLGGADRWQLNP